MPLIQEQFFDIGANLTHKSFKEDLDLVLAEANKLGVRRLSVTGSSLKESIEAFEISRRYPESCISTAGIHPHNSKEYSPESFSEIKDLLKNDLVKSIGETGLDFNRNFSSPEDQQKSFEAHLELSIEISKPLFLHERDAHEKFVEITEGRVGEDSQYWLDSSKIFNDTQWKAKITLKEGIAETVGWVKENFDKFESENLNFSLRA